MNKFASRLLSLATFLEELPRKRFFYGTWVGPTWKGKSDLSCGTTACALGWATVLPEFRRLGLRLDRDDSCITIVHNKRKKSIWDRLPFNSQPFLAGWQVFDLTKDEFDYLFTPREVRLPVSLDSACGEGPLESATAKQVARHIRRFVRFKYPRGK